MGGAPARLGPERVVQAGGRPPVSEAWASCWLRVPSPEWGAGLLRRASAVCPRAVCPRRLWAAPLAAGPRYSWKAS